MRLGQTFISGLVIEIQIDWTGEKMRLVRLNLTLACRVVQIHELLNAKTAFARHSLSQPLKYGQLAQLEKRLEKYFVEASYGLKNATNQEEVERMLYKKLLGRFATVFQLSTISVWPSWLLFPSILLDHMCQLDDELSLLVLLAGLKCMLVLPSESGFTAVAEYICNSVQACEKHSLLGRAAANIHYGVEEVGPALTALEGFTNELIMVGQMSSTVNTRISSVATGQVCTECLHHLYVVHWRVVHIWCTCGTHSPLSWRLISHS